MREIWNGQGDAEGKAYWTKDNGEIVGRPYVRKRVSAVVRNWKFLLSEEVRRGVIAQTVDNDAWMRSHAGETVGSVCRAAVDALLDRVR